MSQHTQEQARRVSVSAFVDAKQREALVELARREDRSVSSIVRTALARHLDRPEQTAVAAQPRERKEQ